MRRTYNDSDSWLEGFTKDGDQEGGFSKLGYRKSTKTGFLDFICHSLNK